MIAGAAMGEITVNYCNPNHLNVLIEKLIQAGAKIDTSKNSITIKKANPINPVDVTTEVYPGFPTDLQAQWIALMAIASGSSVVTDTVYHDRFTHIPELNRLGANIELRENMAIINGVDHLIGAPVMSTDIRASAALIIGAIMARGKTDISRIYHIDRGYEFIEKKFQALGVDIIRKND